MRSRWLGAPASDDRGPGPRWGGGLARDDLEGAGIKEGARRPKSQPPPQPHSPTESALSSKSFLRKRVPSPTLWPAGVHYYKPPRPQPSLFSLVTSGIQMWKPNRLILKGDQQQGRETAGALSAPVGKEGFSVAPLQGPITPGPSASRHLGHLLCTDKVWGTGVQGLTGRLAAGRVCVIGLWGPRGRRRALGAGKQEGHRAGGVRGVPNTPAHPLQGAEPQAPRS